MVKGLCVLACSWVGGTARLEGTPPPPVLEIQPKWTVGGRVGPEMALTFSSDGSVLWTGGFSYGVSSWSFPD
ncbi:hypothetical protein, partial [Limisphaera ngatamarikiensis]|uniref:hypothetical protein n=1 Tax=Limisphaera ngatamarikiensis TaxID=1324935 RepID=UPI001981980D